MKPLIGISSFHKDAERGRYVSLNRNYTDSVARGGGLPVVLAASPDLADYAALLDRLDGIVFSGGNDVSPLAYGSEFSPRTVSVASERDETELALARLAYERGIPILGICRGIQLLNVALGGTLIQDIPTEVPGAIGHNSEMAMNELAHWADADAGSRLERLFGKRRFLVNSFHHQALKEVAPALAVTARASDGIIEAVEGRDAGRWLHAVQFHPEGLTGRYPEFIALFADLVQAAAAYRARR